MKSKFDVQTNRRPEPQHNALEIANIPLVKTVRISVEIDNLAIHLPIWTREVENYAKSMSGETGEE